MLESSSTKSSCSYLLDCVAVWRRSKRIKSTLGKATFSPMRTGQTQVISASVQADQTLDSSMPWSSCSNMGEWQFSNRRLPHGPYQAKRDLLANVKYAILTPPPYLHAKLWIFLRAYAFHTYLHILLHYENTSIQNLTTKKRKIVR